MKCVQCNEEIDQDSRFCRHCGGVQTTANIAQLSKPLSPISTRPLVRTPRDDQRRTLGILAALVIASLMVWRFISSSGPSPAERTADIEADRIEASADAEADRLEGVGESQKSDGVPKLRTGAWSYSTAADRIRGGTAYFASTTSINTVHQDPPYDPDTTMVITVRKTPSAGSDVLISISSGQLLCPSYEGCSGTVRFDDAPARSVRFLGPADDSNDTIFVIESKSFINDLKRSKRLIIEKTLYNAGEPQFEFDVSGLKWEH